MTAVQSARKVGYPSFAAKRRVRMGASIRLFREGYVQIYAALGAVANLVRNRERSAWSQGGIAQLRSCWAAHPSDERQDAHYGYGKSDQAEKQEGIVYFGQKSSRHEHKHAPEGQQVGLALLAGYEVTVSGHGREDSQFLKKLTLMRPRVGTLKQSGLNAIR